MRLSEVEFASFLSYSVRGDDELAVESRWWRSALKEEWRVKSTSQSMSEVVARRLAIRLPEMPFADVFSPTAVLIPVPSTRLLKAGSLWVPLLLARAMVRAGLGGSVEPWLERETALQKAARSRPENRPTAAQQHASLRMHTPMFVPESVVLVDDVVTRGATLLGAANRVREALPRARIHCFAVMRAVSDREDFVAILDPKIGRILLRSDGATQRRP